MHVLLNPKGTTISQVVTFVTAQTPGAVFVHPITAAKFERAIEDERQLQETLRNAQTN